MKPIPNETVDSKPFGTFRGGLYQGPHSDSWKLRSQTLSFSDRPCVMGILNVTPDSFSDGGQFAQLDSAVRQAERLIAEGADILDIGGESTRPYSSPVAVDEELRRIAPVIKQVCQRFDVPVSIDTSKAAVARAAMDEGAEIINDVTALTGDIEMLECALRYQPGICAMHMQGTPQTMQNAPRYQDVVAEIYQYLASRRDSLLSAGVDAERICLDPGIGFGKEHHHNIELVQNAYRFHQLGFPLLVGHSRKGFIAKLIGSKERSRLGGTLGVSLSLALQRIQIIRVHDVGPTIDAIRLFMKTRADTATAESGSV